MIKCLMERQILCIMSSFHIKGDFFPVSSPPPLLYSSLFAFLPICVCLAPFLFLVCLLSAFCVNFFVFDFLSVFLFLIYSVCLSVVFLFVFLHVCIFLSIYVLWKRLSPCFFLVFVHIRTL